MSSPIFFDDKKNYLKRSPISGAATMPGPNISTTGLWEVYSDFSVPHNLGYVPVFRAYCEFNRDGVIWPITNYFGLYPGGSGIQGAAWADAENLYIRLYTYTTVSGTFNVYYVIYEDFHL